MSEAFSQCVVLGTLRHPVVLEQTPSGTSVGYFELVLREQTTSGQWFSTVVPCQIWGKHIEAASQLPPGQPCLFQGKVARRKRGESWELVISGFVLEAFALAPGIPNDAALRRN